MTSADQPLPGLDDLADDAAQSADAAILRAFGVNNRARLLGQYFEEAEPLTAENAWRHVYRLLLSIDRTTGLAHCYESDKCQPGRPWYGRSLRFHDWIARQLGIEPADVAERIDWLFSRASADLATAAAQATYGTKAAAQRAAYEGRSFPTPGEDPELAAIVVDTLRPWLGQTPPEQALDDLVRRIQAHVTKENKRKNLVGEGFEDTLATVLRRLPAVADSHEVLVRQNLHDLPGFRRPSGKHKIRQVDVALVRKRDSFRTLVTVKWSIRSDREEQFPTDFGDYSRLETLGEDFDYVLVTNEYDAARLLKACDVRRENAALFNDVVHVSPAGPVEVYGPQFSHSAKGMSERVASGRLQSLADWLGKLSQA